MIRKHLFYRGNVQGVGFRYTAQRTAAHYNVTGYVKNNYDGRVEIMVEGDPDQIDSFLDDLAQKMHGYISQVDSQQQNYTGEFDCFDISF